MAPDQVDGAVASFWVQQFVGIASFRAQCPVGPVDSFGGLQSGADKTGGRCGVNRRHWEKDCRLEIWIDQMSFLTSDLNQNANLEFEMKFRTIFVAPSTKSECIFPNFCQTKQTPTWIVTFCLLLRNFASFLPHPVFLHWVRLYSCIVHNAIMETKI